MEKLTDMVSNDGPLSTWKIQEGNMNMESVRIILTKNLSKKKPCAKQTSKNLWQDKKFYETVQQDCWKQDLSGEEEKSDLCQRQSSGTSQYNAKVKVKVKFSLEQATKAQRGSRCIALLFLQPRS